MDGAGPRSPRPRPPAPASGVRREAGGTERSRGPRARRPVAIGPWRRHSRREVYRNPWLTLWHDEVQRPDGSAGIYGVVHFENTAVGVVAVDAQDRVALVSQHRYTLDRLSWEIPEGGSRPDEDSARRRPSRAARGDRRDRRDTGACWAAPTSATR